MAYYVLGPGGSKHGPAELPTLNLWIAEGRLTPDTLIEDIGSGVKMPARAVRGLTFAGGLPASSTPVSSAPVPSIGRVSQLPISNYLRPGLGTGGSDRNLFLPSANSKWATHGLLCAGGGLLFAAISGLTAHQWHFHISRFLFLAFGLSVYGVRCGFVGFNQGESGRGALIVFANVFSFIVAIALTVWGFSAW